MSENNLKASSPANLNEELAACAEASSVKPKMSAGRKVLCVFDFLFAAISLLCFVFSAYCYIEIVLIKSAGNMGFGEGLSVAVLIILAIMSSIVVLACALIGLIFFIISLKAKHPASRKISRAVFIYHISATVLCIMTFVGWRIWYFLT